MAEDTKITNPVEIKDNSKERVAFDLMNVIASDEYDGSRTEQKNRKYWLSLYCQCLKATSGYPLESILKEA